MKRNNLRCTADERGFTLVELLVYIAVSGIVMAGIYSAFKTQQDSYLVQEQLAIMQQNLRAAMHLLTDDIQMAGYYTCHDPLAFVATDWDGDTNNETIRPMLFGATNTIVIFQANRQTIRTLVGAESANEGVTTITLATLTPAFDVVTSPYGVIMKEDLTRAEFFRVDVIAGTNLQVTIASATGFRESYSPADGDLIARADVIRYWVDGNANLWRTNLGDGSNDIVAENITGLQLQYWVSDAQVGEVLVNATSGTKPAPPSGDGQPYTERDIRSVQVTLISSVTVSPALGTKTRRLTSTVRIRNMGLEMI